ncbi:MAG: bifunctional folylpolyglutamate synthase/dihydrofolate synthase [Acidimicrobiales bacterium]
MEAIEAGLAGRFALPSLERITSLVDAMGDPQHSYPVIHVTGTNGKGSSSRMCAALLSASGLRVGLYSSPHLEAMNERMSIAGKDISDDELCAQLVALAELEAFLGVGTTWFELVTAAAFRWFADEAVDAAVVEVGLGGRYDATNVADAAVAVVTNVDLDHTEILGHTRAEIAAEKAGIIKSSSAVVIGEEDEAIVSIFEEQAATVGAAPLWRRGVDFGEDRVRSSPGGHLFDLYTPHGRYDDVSLPLFGSHQVDNAAVALAAVQVFLGGLLTDEVVANAYSSVRVPGRMEVVRRRPMVVLDGAHNPAGARVAGRTLAEDFAGVRRIVVVMGCLRSHDPAELLDGLIGPASAGPGPVAGGPGHGVADRVAAVVACTPPSPRALPAEEVATAASARGLEAHVGGTPADAVQTAAALAGEDGLVLVTGSLYVVGAARSALGGPLLR